MSEKRAKCLRLISICLFALLSVRLLYINIEKGKTYETMAKTQQQRQLIFSQTRGNICDRYGISFTDREKKTLFINGKGEISQSKKDAVFEFETKKRAPTLAGHVIGYTNSDGKGVCGIEALCDEKLKGDGYSYLSYTADANGTPVGNFEIKTQKSKSEKNTELTLDYRIQEIAENVMDKHIKKGAAVVLDCKDFDVLAMVSRPLYDADKIASYKNSKDGELLNRALMPYNAGSVFKIVTSVAALERTEDYTKRYFDCRGSFDIGESHIFACNKKEGHGKVFFDEAFAGSCNCSFYVTGLEVGGQSLVSTAQKFGMGQELLRVPLGESGGNLPFKDEYTKGEILNLAIGQGEILITPLQCAVMAGTVANGGVRKDVNIIKENKSKNNQSTRVISEENAKTLKDMMRLCVTEGTGNMADKSHVSIAGKTGSAESGWENGGKNLVHGWFCGFFPFEDPKYAIAVLSEGGNSGAKSCVEPFVEMAEKINEIYPCKE